MMEQWMLKPKGSMKDEWYTPEEAVKVILPFIPEGSRILCPFDTENSEFVKLFLRGGGE